MLDRHEELKRRTEQFAIRIHDEESADAMEIHQPQRDIERTVGIDRHRLRLHHFANGENGRIHRECRPLKW